MKGTETRLQCFIMLHWQDLPRFTGSGVVGVVCCREETVKAGFEIPTGKLEVENKHGEK